MKNNLVILRNDNYQTYRHTNMHKISTGMKNQTIKLNSPVS